MNYPFFDDEPKVFDAFERILFSLHLFVILLQYQSLFEQYFL